MAEQQPTAPSEYEYPYDETDQVGDYWRWEIDRDSAFLYSDFAKAFGPEDTPPAKIVEAIATNGVARVLDAGCGTGRMMYDLREYMGLRRQATPDQLRLVGINNQNFSQESRVEAACSLTSPGTHRPQNTLGNTCSPCEVQDTTSCVSR